VTSSSAERSKAEDRAEPRLPAYFSPDGAVAIWNDLSAGRSLAQSPPSSPFPPDVQALWTHPSTAPPLRTVAPTEQFDGYGVFTFPYGPISMGVAEAGRFDVRTYGERILDLAPVAGYKSRRIPHSLIGLSVADAALRVERLVGNFSAAHAAAFLFAAESAMGHSIPVEAAWIRAFAQELQRIYNHLRVIARVAEAASQNVGVAQTHALAEEVLRSAGATFGHRWMFGALLPGGPARRLDAEDRERLERTFDRMSDEFDQLWALFQGSRTFIDRIQTTCPVTREQAVHWGGVGPTLRATGVPWDDRLRAPVVPYNDLFLPIATESEGDALGRVLVRVQEIRSSFLLLEQMLERWPKSPADPVPPANPIAPHRGIGRVESPSGDLVYDVTMKADRVVSVGLRTASDANWPLFALGMRDAVFTDFHFAWESHGIVFAETDR
jgi:Ni,Fe-hydrogenase III large subunit